MASFEASFSLSSLLCQEDEASLLNDGFDEETNIYPMNPFHISEDEDEYVEILLKREAGFGSETRVVSSFDRIWLKNARLNAIDWIFNTRAKFGFQFHTAYLSVAYFDRFLTKRSIDERKPWAIQLLSVACLSLAAKMEEQKVPPLSEYPMEDYIFENKTIMDMELLILCAFEWKLGTVTPFDYLHYFLKKFCGESRPGSIVSAAVDHIVTIAEDINLMDHRPSIIASAAILAAFDGTLTRKTMDLRISVISSWGSVERESVFSCYNQMREIERRRMIKTPTPNLLSTHLISTGFLENSSLSSSGAKRKLDFEDSEDCPVQRKRRP